MKNCKCGCHTSHRRWISVLLIGYPLLLIGLYCVKRYVFRGGHKAGSCGQSEKDE
jgi:hypothetical protein